MAERAGFFQLQSPLDLLVKLEVDYNRLASNPIDVYAAFDFVVTANHLPEWLSKAKCNPGSNDSYGSALRAICKQLANGAKHFASEPGSVIGAVADRGTYGHARYSASLYGSGNLLIEIDEDTAASLGFSHRVISAVQLAAMVLTYWKKHAAIERAAALLQGQRE
jgi:hypothetical protein